MNLTLISIVVLLVSASCQRVDRVNIKSNDHFTLVDSSHIDGKRLNYDPHDRMSYLPVCYLGPPKDTFHLVVSGIPRYRMQGPDKWQGRFSVPDSHSIRIFVDTSFDLTKTIEHRQYSTAEQCDIATSVKIIKAYPVFINNLSGYAFFMGIFGELGFTIKQAKDRHGKWVDLDEPVSYFCGYAANDIVLGPGQVMIAKTLRYNGDITTECRLKFAFENSVIYSNTFTDLVDSKQLD